MDIIARLKNGGIVNIESDQEKWGGCDTCDYGSHYINNIDIELVNHDFKIRSDTMYEYAITQADIMRISLSKAESYPNMTEEEFVEYFASEILKLNKKAQFVLDKEVYYPNAVIEPGKSFAVDNLLEVRMASPCLISEFFVAGNPANIEDFARYINVGDCGAIVSFSPSERPNRDIMEKFDITAGEYMTIASLLEQLIHNRKECWKCEKKHRA